MRDIVLHAPSGDQIALGQVADVTVTGAAQVINREEEQRRVVVMTNVRGCDLGAL